MLYWWPVYAFLNDVVYQQQHKNPNSCLSDLSAGSPNGLSLNKDIWDIFVDCKIVKENPNNNNNGGNSGLSLIRIFFVQCWRGGEHYLLFII